MAKGNYKIPFDANGHQLHYADVTTRDVDWREIEAFEDVLIYVGYARSRSAAYFNFLRFTNGKLVTMFMSDMNDAIPHMFHGKLEGAFTFVKKGSNFGVQLVKSGHWKEALETLKERGINA